MNDLLFYTLLIALAYYFMVYAKPSPDPANSQPKLTHSRSTQTDTIISEPATLNCPGPEFTSNQTLSSEDQTALENTLDQLIKGMTELSKEIDKS
jgi:hypothetical protein